MYSPISDESVSEAPSKKEETKTSGWDQRERSTFKASHEKKKEHKMKSHHSSKHKLHKSSHKSKHHSHDKDGEGRKSFRPKSSTHRSSGSSKRRGGESRDFGKPSRLRRFSRSQSKDRFVPVRHRHRSPERVPEKSSTRSYRHDRVALIPEGSSDQTTFIGEMMRHTSNRRSIKEIEGSKLLEAVSKCLEKNKEAEKEEGECSEDEEVTRSAYTPPLHLLQLQDKKEEQPVIEKAETIVSTKPEEKTEDIVEPPPLPPLPPALKKKSVLELPMPPILINIRPSAKRSHDMATASKNLAPTTPDLKPENFKHRETHFKEMCNHLDANPVVISPEGRFPDSAKTIPMTRRPRPTVRNRPCPLPDYPDRTFDSFEILKKVGEGTYGQVFKAMDLVTKQVVAMKYVQMDKEGFPITGLREIKILRELQHPNIVQLREIVDFKEKTYLVFEYMNYDLMALLSRNSMVFDEITIYRIFRPLLEGLNYCHKRQILHRDLKCANILINAKGEVKLADFGLGRPYIADRPFTNKVISIWYRPIELLLGEEKYGPHVDIWSLACIFAELFQRRALFPFQTELEMISGIFNLCGTPTKNSWPEVKNLSGYQTLKYEPRRRILLETFSKVIPSLALELLDKMLCLNPEKRITAEEALKSNWIIAMSEKKLTEPIKLPVESDCHELDVRNRRKANLQSK